jgi:hypothetical protein
VANGIDLNYSSWFRRWRQEIIKADIDTYKTFKLKPNCKKRLQTFSNLYSCWGGRQEIY